MDIRGYKNAYGNSIVTIFFSYVALHIYWLIKFVHNFPNIASIKKMDAELTFFLRIHSKSSSIDLSSLTIGHKGVFFQFYILLPK